MIFNRFFSLLEFCFRQIFTDTRYNGFNHGHLMALVLYEILLTFKIPYFAYIFATVSKDHFSSVSSFTHAAVFAGHFIGAVSVQLITNYTISGQTVFNLIFSAQIIATLIAVCLPKLERLQSPLNLCNHNIWIFEQLKFACTNYRIMIWSFWFIGSTIIMNQFKELLPKCKYTQHEHKFGRILGNFTNIVDLLCIHENKASCTARSYFDVFA